MNPVAVVERRASTGGRFNEERVMHRRTGGFTLIEVMIVVAILGVLAAIVYPSYMEYVRRGQRAEAKSLLLQNAQFLERNMTENNRYDKDGAGNDIALPFTSSPQNGDATYSIAANPLDDTTYTLQASRQAGTMMENDECGTFTLDHRGQKGLSSNTRSVDECWNQ